jgi:hypothetical protein
LFWLAVAAAVAAVAAVTGIKPVGTRPVARTGLMAVARIVLIVVDVILIALFLSRKGPDGVHHGLSETSHHLIS